MLQPPQPPGRPIVVEPPEFGTPADPIAPLREALRGHYDILREVGQGAFATVYLAQDLKHERKVALKVLHADPTSETGELRFIREIRLLARLQNPNILPLHDSGHVEALLYYVMPYVAGETLRDRINRERHIDVAAACSITREVADALAYAHGQGVIHRDIKPENILLSAGHPILADFGIARAIDLAGVRQLTQTGMGSPGTPAYMSPEQLMGDRELDGRSDTYSLGCVLFEMLTGTPPFSGKEGFVKRFTEPPPPVSPKRKDAPRWIDDVIAKSLARDPNDRYQTAHELASALVRSMTATGERVVRERIARELAASGGATPAVSVPSATQFRAPIDVKKALAEEARARHQHTPLRRLRTMLGKHAGFAAAAAIAVVLLGVLLISNATSALRNAVFPSGLDSARVALVPFSGTASRADRDKLTSALYAALTEWQELSLTSDQDIADALRSSGAPGSTRAAADVAKRAGAGRFIWGQVDAESPSEVRVQLFDAVSGATLRSTRIEQTADRVGFARAVSDLLMVPNRPASANGGDGKTSSFTAWTAYGRGHVAMSNGDFDAAERNFRDAVNKDPNFAAARVWLAQTLAWRGPYTRGDWREQAAQGLAVPNGLADRDHLIGIAVSRMADRRYPDACSAYSQLTRTDSLDFVGLFGLGQCQALDSVVVRSSHSPSGWRFRSRYSDAASAFMRALTVNPQAHSILSFEQLQELLPTASTKTRQGSSADGQRFAAYPALVRDTVIFVPYPLAEFANLPAERTAIARNAALQANLDALYEFATDWTRRASTSSASFIALADVLEARGEILRNRTGSISAIGAAIRAREFASTPREKQVAASKEAWLRFKQGEFSRARLIADSLLASPAKDLDEARTLIGLAALTGKIGNTAELARITNDYAVSASSLPVPIMDAAASFFAFAALGVCSDTTRALEGKLDEELAHNVAEVQELQLRRAVKARPLSMLAPCTDARSSLRVDAGANRLLNLQQAFANRDTRMLQSLLARITEDAKTQRPGDISLDNTYQVAWLRSAIGDTAGATRQLDRALGALPSLSAVSLRDAASAAAAGRAMALRAELANARNEDEQRRKWARAVADLWATADAPLQEVVARMRLLAAKSVRN